EKDAAARRLQDGDIRCFGERAGRAAEPRAVALLDQLTVTPIDDVPSLPLPAESPPRRAVAPTPARRSDEVCEEPDRGGLSVRARDRDHRDLGLGDVGFVARFGGRHPFGRLGAGGGGTTY